MGTPLILTGNLKLGPAVETATDVSDEVTAFKVTAAVDTIEIPATLATPKSARGGAASYAVEIGYLSNDEASSLFDILWTAVGTASKELYFEGSMRDDIVSEDNPLWTGTLIVTAAEVGGDAEGLSSSSATFPLTGAPEKLTSPGSS